MDQLAVFFHKFLASTGFANFGLGHFFMIVVASTFIYLAIRKHYEPLLLIPIGFGILFANIPMPPGFELISPAFMAGESGPSTIMDYLYMGVMKGFYPPLIFLGIGALTDFSSLIANPRLVLLGAAAQFGIFVTLAGALLLTALSVWAIVLSGQTSSLRINPPSSFSSLSPVSRRILQDILPS